MKDLKERTSGLDNTRLLHYDALRVVAIFFVIVAHTCALGFYDLDVRFYSWSALNIYDSISRFCVPVLVMISGTFFLDKNREYTFHKLFHHNIARIVTVFIFWSFLYAVSVSFAKSHGKIDSSSIQAFIEYLITGYYHLWFMLMLISLYLLVPFLRKITETKQLTEYFLLLWFVFALLFPFIGKIPVTGYYTDKLCEQMRMFFVLGHSGYFVLGHYLHTYGMEKRTKRIVYVLGTLSVIFTIVMTYWVSNRHQMADSFFLTYLIPTTCATASAIFIFFRDKISTISFSQRQRNIIITLSKYSFGIYLVHIFALLLVTKFIPVTLFNPFLSVPIIAVLTFMVSLIAIFIIDKIPFLKRFIM